MPHATKKKCPRVRLVQDMKPPLIEQIRSIGLWRCHSLIPDCRAEPVAEVTDAGGISHLYCRRHTASACRALELPEPTYPQDSN